jgi:hypothetical protein
LLATQRARFILPLAGIVLFWASAVPAGSQKPDVRPRTVIAAPAEPDDGGRPDFARMLRLQAETDRTWRSAGDGFMQVEKISYRSSKGDLDIPAFVFQPLRLRGTRQHPALVWVHENIRGHLYEHYIPYSRATAAYRHRAGISRQHRLWQAVLRRNRLRRRRVDDGDGGHSGRRQVSRGGSRTDWHHQVEPRRADPPGIFRYRRHSVRRKTALMRSQIFFSGLRAGR